jgi:hypothetical protein
MLTRRVFSDRDHGSETLSTDRARRHAPERAIAEDEMVRERGGTMRARNAKSSVREPLVNFEQRIRKRAVAASAVHCRA